MTTPSKVAFSRHCDLCNAHVYSQNGFEQHLSSLQHTRRVNALAERIENRAATLWLSCQQCYENTRGIASIQKHAEDTGHKCVTCKICNETFSSITALKSHLMHDRKHCPIQTGPHYCKVCNEYFGWDQKALSMHVVVKDHSAYSCPKCARPYVDDIAVETHLSSCGFHGDGNYLSTRSDEDFRCRGCGRSFSAGLELSGHIRFVKACPICDEHLYTCSRLQQHLGKEHAPHDIGCWGCSTRLTSQSNMIQHIESGHCPADPDGVTLKSTLRNLPAFMPAANRIQGKMEPWYAYTQYIPAHKTVGVDPLRIKPFWELQYYCPHCGTQFNTLADLLQHILSERSPLWVLYGVIEGALCPALSPDDIPMKSLEMAYKREIAKTRA